MVEEGFWMLLFDLYRNPVSVKNSSIRGFVHKSNILGVEPESFGLIYILM